MALVFSFGRHRHLHPPAAAFIAFPEGQLIVLFAKLHDIFGQSGSTCGVIAFSVEKAFEEIPQHLRGYLRRLPVSIMLGRIPVDAEGGEFVAMPA